MKGNKVRAASLLMSLSLLAGCAGVHAAGEPASLCYVDQTAVDAVELLDEAVALSAAPSAALPDAVKVEAAQTEAELVKAYDIVVPVASGTAVKKTGKAIIDYSNTSDGYVMVKFTGSTTKRLKAQVQGPAVTYTYNITPGEWTVFPLSDGNGNYQFKVFENKQDSKYTVVASVGTKVTLKDEFAPFIRPNQYVNYSEASKVVAAAQELTKDITDPLKKVEVVYDFVISNLTYDKDKAAAVCSGYLPELDEVLDSKKGICFDYAALMTGMLRSQGIPCKLVIGYAGTVYHAWISVWSEATGWIEGAVYFDGTAWQRMDPTCASTGGQSEEIMKFIGDGTNYTVKYLY